MLRATQSPMACIRWVGHGTGRMDARVGVLVHAQAERWCSTRPQITWSGLTIVWHRVVHTPMCVYRVSASYLKTHPSKDACRRF